MKLKLIRSLPSFPRVNVYCLLSFLLLYCSCLLLLLVGQIHANYPGDETTHFDDVIYMWDEEMDMYGIEIIYKCFELGNGTTICHDEMIIDMAYCAPQNSAELYTCLYHNRTLSMTLTSGQEYWIDATSAMEITGSQYPFLLMGQLKINTTDLDPAILRLGDFDKKEAFLQSSIGNFGSFEMRNIHVKGSGQGRFIGSGWNISLINCTVSDYNISNNQSYYGRDPSDDPGLVDDAGTSFISMGPQSSLVIHNSRFLNNYVHSNWSSLKNPSFLVGMDSSLSSGGSRNWTFSIANCDFVNNTISNVEFLANVNALFYFGLLTADDNTEWNMKGNRFTNNTVSGYGSSFFFFYNEENVGQGTTFLRLENSIFTQNIVSQQQIPVGLDNADYHQNKDWGLQFASFFLIMYQSMEDLFNDESDLIEWEGNFTPLDIQTSVFSGNWISRASYFFNYRQPNGSITIENSSFTGDVVEDESVLIFYNSVAGDINLINVNVENITVQDAAAFLAAGYTRDNTADPYASSNDSFSLTLSRVINLSILSSKFESNKVLGSSTFIDLFQAEGGEVEINNSVFTNFLLLETGTIFNFFQGFNMWLKKKIELILANRPTLKILNS